MKSDFDLQVILLGPRTSGWWVLCGRVGHDEAFLFASGTQAYGATRKKLSNVSG